MEIPEEGEILYDIVEDAEWPQLQLSQWHHPHELLFKDTFLAPLERASHNLQRVFSRLLLSKHYLSEEHLQWIEKNESQWPFSCTATGYVATVVSNVIEVRTSSNAYDAPILSANIPDDLFARFSKICWSPDGSRIALASSTGRIYILTDRLRLLCTFSANPLHASALIQHEISIDFAHAICGMSFAAAQQWLITLSFNGELRLVSIVDETSVVLFTLDISAQFKHIGCFEYSPFHNMILVGGTSKAGRHKLAIWRLGHEQPFFIPVELTNTAIFPWASDAPLCQLSISLDSSKIATVDCQGCTAILSLPSLRVEHAWSAPDVTRNMGNVDRSFTTGATARDDAGAPFAVHVRWFSGSSLAVGLSNGAFLVASLPLLQNRLGASADFVPPIAAISDGREAATLQRHCHLLCQDMQVAPSIPSLVDNIKSFAVKLLRGHVDNLSRMQRVNITLKLLRFQATTPEALFTSKMASEEYGEALLVAQRFGLDEDRVYKEQWMRRRNQNHAVGDFLAKVNDREWVLNECLTFVPASAQAARQLFELGVRITSWPKVMNDPAATAPEAVVELDEVMRSPRYHVSRQQTLRRLFCERAMLLRRLDLLRTFEVVCEWTKLDFSPAAFVRFSSGSVVNTACIYASDGNIGAVHAILTRHWRQLNPFRLFVVGHIPEFVTPNSYAKLLPKCLEDGTVEHPPCNSWREPDWVEQPEWMEALQVPQLDTSDHIPPALTSESYNAWVVERAEAMDACGLCDNAHTMVGVGLSKGVPGLEPLLHDLQFLNLLVYECGYPDMKLAAFRQLSLEERIGVLMTGADARTFETLFRERVLRVAANLVGGDQPAAFLSTLRTVFLKQSQTDLTNISLLVKAVINADLHPLTTEWVISLAMDCVSSSQNAGDLDRAVALCRDLEVLLSREASSSYSEQQRFNTLMRTLDEASLLQSYNISKPASFYVHSPPLEACEQIAQTVMKTATRRSTNLSSMSKAILILWQLHSGVLSALDAAHLAKICLHSLLRSGEPVLVKAAGSLIESGQSHTLSVPGALHVSNAVAEPFVLSAAEEYFNSSTTTKDIDFENARTCLGLIHPPSVAITKEINLCDACELFTTLGLPVLPVKLRSDDRLAFIQELLTRKLVTKDQRSLVLQLATKLGLCAPPTGTHRVDVLLAEYYFEQGEVNLATKICFDLIESNYDECWPVCVNLGRCERLDFQSRSKLLSFALATSPDVASILEAWQMLELEERSYDAGVLDDHIASVNPKEIREALLSSAEKHAGLFRNRTVSAPPPGLHPFFRSNTKCLSFSSQPLVTGGARLHYTDVPMQLRMALTLARTIALLMPLNHSADTRSKLDVAFDELSLFIAKSVAGGPALDAFPWLLALRDVRFAEEFFEKLEQSITNVHLERYYYALRLLEVSPHSATPALRECMTMKGRLLLQPIKAVLDNISVADADDASMAVSFLAGKFQQSSQSVDLLACLQELEAAGFSTDAFIEGGGSIRKRRDAVLVLSGGTKQAMSFALRLGPHFGLSRAELFWHRASSILLHAQPSDIDKSLQQENIYDELKTSLAEALPFLEASVYPHIGGSDYARLGAFYTLMSKLQHDAAEQGQEVSLQNNYIELLRLFSKVSPAVKLDFKTLVHSGHPLVEMRERLSDENVSVLARLANKIPASGTDSGFLTSSMVYQTYALRLFSAIPVAGCDDESRTIPNAWMRGYERCKTHFPKIEAADLEKFLEEAIMSQRGVDLPPLIRRFVCKDILSALRKMPESDPGRAAALQRVLRLDDMFNAQSASEEVVRLRAAFPAYARAIDLAGSNIHELQCLCYKLFLEGQPLDLVTKLVTASGQAQRVFSPLSSKEMLLAALKALVAWLGLQRGTEFTSRYFNPAAAQTVANMVADEKTAVLYLQRILSSCKSADEDGSLGRDAVAACLEILALTQDGGVSVAVLKLLNGALGPREDLEGHLALAIARMHSTSSITADDFSTVERRAAYFRGRIAQASDDASHPVAVLSIISALHVELSGLPDDFAALSSAARAAILQQPASVSIPALVHAASMRLPDVPEAEELQLIQLVSARCAELDAAQPNLRTTAAKAILLLSGRPQAIAAVVSLLSAAPSVDAHLSLLLTARGAAPALLRTALYASFSRALVEAKPADIPPRPTVYPSSSWMQAEKLTLRLDAVRSLAGAGHWAHAASLLVRLRGGVANLDVALVMLSRFMELS